MQVCEKDRTGTAIILRPGLNLFSDVTLWNYLADLFAIIGDDRSNAFLRHSRAALVPKRDPTRREHFLELLQEASASAVFPMISADLIGLLNQFTVKPDEREQCENE